MCKSIRIYNREKQLNGLLKCYEEHEEEMCQALASDLRKHKQEAMINEVEFLRNDLRNLLMNLRTYAAPEKVLIVTEYNSLNSN